MCLPFDLHPRSAGGGSVTGSASEGWRLQIPAGDGRAYRLAQLDDHRHLARDQFPWRLPLRLSLSARVSAAALPGTWGFGFWNDPFSAQLGLGGMARKLPSLPNAAWFFHACELNYLSFNDQAPGNGFLTAVYNSPCLPPLLILPAALGLPLLSLRPISRMVRRIASRLIAYCAACSGLNPTRWRRYEIMIDVDGTRFNIDRRIVFQTTLAPNGALGFVLWIDNQFAAYHPNGSIKAGRRAHHQPAWLDIRELSIEMG